MTPKVSRPRLVRCIGCAESSGRGGSPVIEDVAGFAGGRDRVTSPSGKLYHGASTEAGLRSAAVDGSARQPMVEVWLGERYLLPPFVVIRGCFVGLNPARERVYGF